MADRNGGGIVAWQVPGTAGLVAGTPRPGDQPIVRTRHHQQ
ncbi:hypothetical protein KCH_23710 [Kitasatospora cheerisanensis KCTC 2395]|uniref:Uncharacterized protein n=1 Tax=Kitasatospora cheerisanensis KCTC 2395 TaxID=1348663 RepID=A0A066Z6S3_9ACTN|nr:hypothetical protein KCH_23710 [Kitasatospora cheerisanensis KCTC 2395]